LLLFLLLFFFRISSADKVQKVVHMSSKYELENSSMSEGTSDELSDIEEEEELGVDIKEIEKEIEALKDLESSKKRDSKRKHESLHSDKRSKRKKKDSTSPKKRKAYENGELWLVEGCAYGLNKGHSDGAYNFKITRKIECEPKAPKIIPIPCYSALPTYCPWINFRVKVKPPERGQSTIYRIVEVVGCSYITVKKIHVKEYLLNQYKMTQTNDEKFKKQLKAAFFRVPAEITCRADISEKMEDEYIKKITLDILSPRFRGTAIMSLLPYFSYHFLSNFDERQALVLLYIAVQQPHLFCFWDKLVSILTQVHLHEEPLFPNKNFELDVDLNYIYWFLEQMDSTESYPVYSAAYPVWNIQMLKKAVRDFSRWNPDTYDFEVISVAVKIYLQYYKEKNSFKNTIISIQQTNFNAPKEVVDKSIQFLQTNKILFTQAAICQLFPNTDMDSSHNTIVDPTTTALELEFVCLLKDKLKAVSVYNCLDYGEEFVECFNGLVTDEFIKKNKLHHLVFLTANKNSAKYMTDETGFEFQTIYRHVKNEKNAAKAAIQRNLLFEKQSSSPLSKNSNSRNNSPLSKNANSNSNSPRNNSPLSKNANSNNNSPRNSSPLSKNANSNSNSPRKLQSTTKNIYLIDRLHKCSLLELVELLRIIPRNSELYVFGDINEYGPNSKKGTHHIFYEMCYIFETKLLPYCSTSKRSHLSALRNELSNGKFTNLEIEQLKNEKELESELNEIEKQIDIDMDPGNANMRKHWNNKKISENELQNRGYIIFCSNEIDKQTVSNILLAKKSRTYKKTEFKIGDKVHILEDDMIGRLHSVWKTDIHGNKIAEMDSKKYFNILKGYYSFSLYKDTDTYNTSQVTVDHAEVCVISKYAGAASDYVIFVASPETVFSDIVIATKYARKKFKLFLLPEANIMQIYQKKRNFFEKQYKSDLRNKLKILSSDTIL